MNSSSPASGKIGIYWNSGTSRYEITSNLGSAVTLYSWDVLFGGRTEVADAAGTVAQMVGIWKVA